MNIILYEMKIEGFHKLSLRFFKLAVISSQYQAVFFADIILL